MNQIDPELPIEKRIALAMQTEQTFRGIANKASIKSKSLLLVQLEKNGSHSNRPRLIVEKG